MEKRNGALSKCPEGKTTAVPLKGSPIPPGCCVPGVKGICGAWSRAALPWVARVQVLFLDWAVPDLTLLRNRQEEPKVGTYILPAPPPSLYLQMTFLGVLLPYYPRPHMQQIPNNMV